MQEQACADYVMSPKTGECELSSMSLRLLFRHYSKENRA
nr:MAG TPA: hypothetical protein [Caudoviricetes sp.]